VRVRGDRRLSLGGHFRELRRRLLVSAVAILIGLVAAFAASDILLVVLQGPIRDVAVSRDGTSTMLNFDAVTSAFDLRIRLSLTIGLVVASPVWLWQLWAFFAPAMRQREGRYVIGFLGSAIPLFFVGCYVGWAVVPHVIYFMAEFVPIGGALFYNSSLYFDFILKLVLITGVAFAFPAVLVLLSAAGVMTHREIARGWRVAVIVITIFTAMATPAADVLSMLVLAVPMVALYGATIVAAWAIARVRERSTRKSLTQKKDALAQ
jgi:sec-independent protein translocase protein TatC